MPLELRKNPDGTIRKWWYGRYEVNGKRYCHNLGVKITGKPPASLSLMDEGDAVFERSRATALAKLASLVEEARTKRHSARLVERLYELKTGEQVRGVALTHLPDEWERIPRRRKLNQRYAAQCRSTLARFAEFVRSQNPRADDISYVTRDMARAFMRAEEARGVTAKTWNDTLKLLRASFKYLLPAGAVNPFSDIPTRETETIFRKPFTPEELKAIVEAARQDEFIRPIVITGICTAMRRGDCCLLKWKDVDLKRGFITVKTSKTGQTVSIPIFPMLQEELALQPRVGEFVFPQQAEMYLRNPDGVTQRVQKVLAAAGFRDSPEKGSGDGPIRGEIHVERKEGLRRASVRDFHSFRVTWVTLALTAGVPLELVQKVTGHRTTDIVLKHYFQPGREEFRRALQSAMPKLLTDGRKTPKEQMLEILNHTTPRSWRKDVERLRELLRLL